MSMATGDGQQDNAAPRVAWWKDRGFVAFLAAWLTIVGIVYGVARDFTSDNDTTPTPIPPTSGPIPSPTPTETTVEVVEVFANEEFGVSTGLVVTPGERLTFRVVGADRSWCWGPRRSDTDHACPGPAGTNDRPDANDQCPETTLPGSDFGLLIGQVGGLLFPIGASDEPIVMEESGELKLLMNDCEGLYEDNQERLSVEVGVEPADS